MPESYDELNAIERLEVLVNTVGDLKIGFARSVDPARWTSDYQHHLREVIAMLRADRDKLKRDVMTALEQTPTMIERPDKLRPKIISAWAFRKELRMRLETVFSRRR